MSEQQVSLPRRLWRGVKEFFESGGLRFLAVLAAAALAALSVGIGSAAAVCGLADCLRPMPQMVETALAVIFGFNTGVVVLAFVPDSFVRTGVLKGRPSDWAWAMRRFGAWLAMTEGFAVVVLGGSVAISHFARGGKPPLWATSPGPTLARAIAVILGGATVAALIVKARRTGLIASLAGLVTGIVSAIWSTWELAPWPVVGSIVGGWLAIGLLVQRALTRRAIGAADRFEVIVTDVGLENTRLEGELADLRIEAGRLQREKEALERKVAWFETELLQSRADTEALSQVIGTVAELTAHEEALAAGPEPIQLSMDESADEEAERDAAARREDGEALHHQVSTFAAPDGGI